MRGKKKAVECSEEEARRRGRRIRRRRSRETSSGAAEQATLARITCQVLAGLALLYKFSASNNIVIIFLAILKVLGVYIYSPLRCEFPETFKREGPEQNTFPQIYAAKK